MMVQVHLYPPNSKVKDNSKLVGGGFRGVLWNALWNLYDQGISGTRQRSMVGKRFSMSDELPESLWAPRWTCNFFSRGISHEKMSTALSMCSKGSLIPKAHETLKKALDAFSHGILFRLWALTLRGGGGGGVGGGDSGGGRMRGRSVEAICSSLTNLWLVSE